MKQENVLGPKSVVSLDNTDASSPVTRPEEFIESELRATPFFRIFDQLKFSVVGRKVTLTGQVTRRGLKLYAERLIRNVKGVQEIENGIEVLPRTRTGRS